MRHLLGPLAEHIDLLTVPTWIVQRYERLTGQLAPAPDDVDWVRLGLAIARTGEKPLRSVIVDDVHHLAPDLAMTMRLLTTDLFATCHASSAHTVSKAINLTPSVALERRRRQPSALLEVAEAWGDTPLSSANEGSGVEGELIIDARSTRMIVEEAVLRYRADRTLRIALTPVNPAHIAKIADLLLHLGLGRSRLFSTDVPPAAIHSWDVGAPGIYVLRPNQTEGLEFDEVTVTGLEQLPGDPSESPIQRQLLAIANATRRRLALHWNGNRKPEAVVILEASRHLGRR